MHSIKHLFTSKKFKLIILPALVVSLPCLSLAADNTYLNHAVKASTQEWAQYPKINYGTGSKAELIKKGEYLAKAG